MTQVAASALLPALAPSLGAAGECGVGAAPWFCNQLVVKTTSLVKGLALGVWDYCGTLEMASPIFRELPVSIC